MNSYNYREMISAYQNMFEIQYGNIEFENIKKRIEDSNKFSKLYYKSLSERTYLVADALVGYLVSIPYFLFKDANTQFLACLFAVENWHIKVNTITQVLSITDLKDLQKEIFLYLDRTKGFKL